MSIPSYTGLAKFLHWLIAGLIASQYVLAELAEQADESSQIVRQLALLAGHKSVGMTILTLALLRLMWRLLHTPPTPPDGLPDWQIRAAAVTHSLLYGLIFLVPLSGWLMSSASGNSVSWFGMFVIPDFINSSELWEDRLHFTHETLAKILFGVAILHILAALKHHFIDQNSVLIRMSSKVGYMVFVLSFAIAVLLLGRVDPRVTYLNSDSTSVSIDDEITTSDIALWQIDYDKSYIRFIGIQAGAPFDGVWHHWRADIRFAPDKLNESRFNVEIDIEAVDTEDQERDETILSEEFFDVQNYPRASFMANDFRALSAKKFITTGLLSIKAYSRRVVFEFEIDEIDGAARLRGKAELNRFDWNIGMGDWVDTTWLGENVQIEVLVQTVPIR